MQLWIACAEGRRNYWSARDLRVLEHQRGAVVIMKRYLCLLAVALLLTVIAAQSRAQTIPP